MSQSNPPSSEFMAQQLRKPNGEAAPTVGQKMDAVNAPLFDLTLEVMQPADNERILEIGFGTGSYFKKLFKQAPGLKVEGIDYSEEMVEIAKANNSDLIDSGQLAVTTGNSDHLPYEDNSFDKVFSNMVVFFWDDPEPHLKEVNRVLKPGGKFYTGIRTKESMKQFPFVDHGFQLFEEAEWVILLKKNGFDLEGTHRSSDEAMEVDFGTIQLESVCLVGQKVV